MLTINGQMYVVNEVNGAYVAGADVKPDQPTTARKTNTATRAARIVNAPVRVMAANVRSPRRLDFGVASGPAFSGETVAVTRTPVVLGCEGAGTAAVSWATAVPAWLDQPAAIWETNVVAFLDRLAGNGADLAAAAAACCP